MEQKSQQVNPLGHGDKIELEAFLPMGEDEGFFFVRPQESQKIRGALQVKAVTLELMDGSTLRVLVRLRKHYQAGSLVWQLARVLKGLVDAKSDLIRTDETAKHWTQYITYKDLAGAFNQDMEIDNAIGLSARVVGNICCEELQLPVGRRSEGGCVYLDEGLLYLMFEKLSWTNLPDESE